MQYNEKKENQRAFEKLSEVLASCRTMNQVYTAYRMAVRYAEIKDIYKVNYLVKDAVKDLRNGCIGKDYLPFNAYNDSKKVTVTEANFNFVVVRNLKGEYEEIKTEVFFNNWKEV